MTVLAHPHSVKLAKPKPITHAWIDPQLYASLVSRPPAQALLVAWLCKKTELACAVHAFRDAWQAGEHALQDAIDNESADFWCDGYGVKYAKAANNATFRKRMNKAEPVQLKWRGLDTILKEQGLAVQNTAVRARLLRDLQELADDGIIKLGLRDGVRIKLAHKWFKNRKRKIPLPYPLTSRNPFFFGLLLYCAEHQWFAKFSTARFDKLQDLAKRVGSPPPSLLDGRRSRLLSALNSGLKEACAIEGRHVLWVEQDENKLWKLTHRLKVTSGQPKRKAKERPLVKQVAKQEAQSMEAERHAQEVRAWVSTLPSRQKPSLQDVAVAEAEAALKEAKRALREAAIKGASNDEKYELRLVIHNAETNLKMALRKAGSDKVAA